MQIEPRGENDPLIVLEPSLIEQVLTRLGFTQPPALTLEGLTGLYRSWGEKVPFDNVRKLIHMRRGGDGPLPGLTPADFFQAWLRHGTGGTCWAGNGSFHALLMALGFAAERGVATMLAAPNLPPNHGTVRVRFEDEWYLVDCSILHGEPLPLRSSTTVIDHPARGLRCEPHGPHWSIFWRPLHKVDGFECRLEFFGAPAVEFRERHDQTRGWSPFNYEVAARLNQGDEARGVAFGHTVTLHADGSVSREPANTTARNQRLREIGFSEEIIAELPADLPTPPPPGTRTAAKTSPQS